LQITGTTAAAFGLNDHVLCNEARPSIQELADGQIDRKVAQVEGWSTFANPNKERVFQECQKQDGAVGGCDEDNYDLLYRGQQVPITEIVELQKSRIQSLHEALKLDLAHYFVPEKLNAISGFEVARSRH
jgi:hypothetical protein